MAAETKFNIDSENLQLFFQEQLASISPTAKESMPKDVAFKLYRGGAKKNAKNTSKLPFVTRLWIMWKYLKKRVWVVVEDEENGLTVDQFLELREAIKKKEKSIDKSEEMILQPTFITSSKELSDCFAVLNNSCASPTYNYIQKAKNGVKLSRPSEITTWKMQMAHIAKFLTYYEGNKKRWVATRIVTIPEYYVLLALYDGKEVKSDTIYNGIFKYAYQSKATAVKKAFGALQNRGLIVKIGGSKQTFFKITELGSEIINDILSKHALKY